MREKLGQPKWHSRASFTYQEQMIGAASFSKLHIDSIVGIEYIHPLFLMLY